MGGNWKDRFLGGSRVVRLAQSHGRTPGWPLEYVYVGGCEHDTIVIVPSGHGKSRVGTVTTSRVIRRFHLLEAVMNLGENRIGMRIPRSAWFPRDLRFPHSYAVSNRVHNSL